MAQEDPPRRRRLVAAAVVLVLLLLLLCLFPLRSLVPGQRPAQSAGHAPSEPSPRLDTIEAIPVDPTDPVEDEEERAEALRIWLRKPFKTWYIKRMQPAPFGDLFDELSPADWDLAFLDDSDTAQALAGIRTMSTTGRDAAEAVEAAEREQVAQRQTESPELAMLSLSVEWMRTQGEQRDRFMTATYAMPSDKPSSAMTSAERRAHYDAHNVGRQDITGIEAQAEQIMELWPDHPVADFARVAMIRVHQEAWSLARETTNIDPTDANRATLAPPEEAIMDIVAAIEEPALRRTAVQVIIDRSTSRPYGFESDLVDALEDIPIHDELLQLSLSTWAMTRKMYEADWDGAARWALRLEEELAEACAVDEPYHGLTCDQRTTQMKNAKARMVSWGSLPESEQKTWQDALTVKAWRCHNTRRPEKASLSKSRATWTGTAWEFGPWSIETPVTKCLTRFPPDSGTPHPDEPMQVDITIEQEPWPRPKPE